MFLTQPGRYAHLMKTFRPLLKDEKIQENDLVEDVHTGRRERVDSGYYVFLIGERVRGALELPGVYQIVRMM